MFETTLGVTRALNPDLAPNQLIGNYAGINRSLVLRLLLLYLCYIYNIFSSLVKIYYMVKWFVSEFTSKRCWDGIKGIAIHIRFFPYTYVKDKNDILLHHFPKPTLSSVTFSFCRQPFLSFDNLHNRFMLSLPKHMNSASMSFGH